MKRSADPNSDKMKAEFRQKLENYEAAPTDNLWDKIELSLDKEEALVYKNRFRIYSRLAAACLLLLLAFGAFFIPNKLRQLKDESPELAITQTPETKRNSSSQVQQSENPATEAALAQAKTTPENATVSEQKTATANSETEALETTEQLAATSKTVSNTKAENAFVTRNPTAGKTIAFNAPNAKPKAQQPDLSVTETSENAMISAAKTARAATDLSETIAAIEPDIATPDVTIAAISEPVNTARINAPDIAVASQKASTASKMPVSETEQTAKNAAVAAAFRNNSAADEVPAVSQTNTFSSQDHSVSLKKEKFKPLPFLKLNNTKLQSAEHQKLMLPDSNMLATIPVAETLSETATQTKKAPQTGKWVLALGYSGSNFQTGMQLASQAETKPGSLISYQHQSENISQYNAAIEEFNQETKSGYSQGGVLQVAYKLTKNWLLQSGFKYFRNQAQTASHYAFSNPQFGNTGTGTSAMQPNTAQTTLVTVLGNNFDPDETQVLKTPESKTSYIFQQIGVPVNLRYQTNAKALYYFGAAGFSMNLLTSATIETEHQQTVYTNSPTKNEAQSLSHAPQGNTFRNWLPAVGLQTGVGYQLSQHWQLEMALEGEQYLKPLIQAEKTAGAKQENPRNVGASLKLGYSF
ncbi:hypothetical protein [Adhaeribacter terreus]|uniref:Outer membrane protein beta-barrel domain-containing protein n=1 Tax=Adhaeribacter terreus TaxID=529703 RepID=A0ABW0E9M7_9BACT